MGRIPLNDMQPYCEHQKEQGYRDIAREKVTLYKWRQTEDTRTLKSMLKDRINDDLKEKNIAKLSPEHHEIYFLPYTIETVTPEVPKYYELKETDTKTRGWIGYDEHPTIGILGKPCSVCGYKYGHAWKKEEVPQSAINFIGSLPNAEISPAWI